MMEVSEHLPKYVITGESRLTGEREVISAPHNYLKTQELLLRKKREFRSKRKPAWIRLRMESAVKEGSLF